MILYRKFRSNCQSEAGPCFPYLLARFCLSDTQNNCRAIPSFSFRRSLYIVQALQDHGLLAEIQHIRSQENLSVCLWWPFWVRRDEEREIERETRGSSNAWLCHFIQFTTDIQIQYLCSLACTENIRVRSARPLRSLGKPTAWNEECQGYSHSSCSCQASSE